MEVLLFGFFKVCGLHAISFSVFCLKINGLHTYAVCFVAICNVRLYVIVSSFPISAKHFRSL